MDVLFVCCCFCLLKGMNMKLTNCFGFFLTLLFLSLTGCGGGSGGSDSGKVAVVGDYTRYALAEFLEDKGLEVDNFTLYPDSRSPAISEKVIVWEDDRNGFPDIYARNLASSEVFRVNQDEGNTEQRLPVADGNYVVWQDNRSGEWEIYARDISSMDNAEFIVSSDAVTSHEFGLAIQGNMVVWRDLREGTSWDIWARNIATMAPEFQVNQVTTGQQMNPKVYGNYVVWDDARVPTNSEIYARDISNLENPEFRVNQVTTGYQGIPIIYGTIVIWSDWRVATNNSDIYARDISTMAAEFRVNQTTTGSQVQPAIHGDLVVWRDYRNGTYDLYARNIATMAADFRVNSGSFPIYSTPAIYENYVVWEEDRTGTMDIYARDIVSDGALEFQVNQAFIPESGRYPVIWGDVVACAGGLTERAYEDIYQFSISGGTEDIASTGKIVPADISVQLEGYSMILFGDRLDADSALDVFNAADAAGVNMLGIGTDDTWTPLVEVLATNDRFGIATDDDYSASDMEIDVTDSGTGHPIFDGIDTGVTLLLESDGDENDEQYISSNLEDPNSPADWTELALFGAHMNYAASAAIVEFTTPSGTTVILDGSANTYDEYDYWTEMRWDLLYNEVIYLMNK